LVNFLYKRKGLLPREIKKEVSLEIETDQKEIMDCLKFPVGRELTDEVLIKEFNETNKGVFFIAKEYRTNLTKLRQRVKDLQEKGLLGKKDPYGRIRALPGYRGSEKFKRAKKKEKNQKTKKPETLAEKLEKLDKEEKDPTYNISNTFDALKEFAEKDKGGDISVKHKEMLIEILHKLIV
jgi:hypothetical protein